MLKQLLIQNLAIVDSLEINFSSGMSALTGETGAGKSILIDALSLCLGSRAEASLVRPGSQGASIAAIFHLVETGKNATMHAAVSHFLKEKSLANEEEEDVCIFRRVISSDGRSKSYINGHPTTTGELKELGEMLLCIHGQHQNQALMKPDYQRTLVDTFAQNANCLDETSSAFRLLEKLKKEKEALSGLQDSQDKLALLEYQIQEFKDFDLKENELQTLEEEHRKLSHAEQWLFNTAQIQSCLVPENSIGDRESENAGNAESSIHQAMLLLASIKQQFPSLESCHEMLNNALIQVQEAAGEIAGFREGIEIDPERLTQVDARLSRLHSLARKHKIAPEQILEHYEGLAREADQIRNARKTLIEIDEKINKATSAYLASAAKLTATRKAACHLLEKAITESMMSLEMKHGRFEIQLTEKAQPGAQGMDDIEFLVTTNPGHPPKPLRKIASGGEMSRLSLAIQVVTAQKITLPTLIFDEVDVGISGKTAEIVGNLMRNLGKHAQVLCVTHLPQVAAKAHHHFKIEKRQTKDSTKTVASELDANQRIQEIARLLGGITITENILAHAKEILEPS